MWSHSKCLGTLVLFAALPQFVACGGDLMGPKADVLQAPEKAEGKEGLFLLPANVHLKVGQFLGLTVCRQDGEEVYEDPAKDIRWWSDAPGIVSVSEEGVVHALTEGFARIRAEIGGEILEVEVTVRES